MTATNQPIDLNPTHLETIQCILNEHVPDCEVRAFGSRAKWNARDYSDLDLAVVGQEPQNWRVLNQLETAFRESDLPFKVDVLDWHDISDKFREMIRSECISIKNAVESDWKSLKLGQCVTINDSTYSTKEAWPFINYLDTGNITENHIESIQHLVAGEDKIPSRARRKVQLGDIVYSMVRPVQKHFGLIKNLPDNFLVSTGFSTIRANPDIAHTEFIYYFLTQDHIIERLQAIAENSTSAYPAIRPCDLEQLDISLPPLQRQRDITQILSVLDNKIELNRRMNETLESMAQSLFKSWFVDFDPVRAKMEGCWRPDESLPGLPAHLYDLFPDRLVPSELGEIPQDWSVNALDDVIQLLSGGTPSTAVDQYWNGEIPWYTAKDAPSFSDIFVIKTERNITQAGVQNSATDILPVGTTIISARGTVGRLALLGLPMAMNQTCYGIRGNDDYLDFFTYWVIRMTIASIQSQTYGTIFDTITRQTFKFVNIVCPPIELINLFEKAITPIMEKVLKNLNESSTLANFKTIWLPGLLAENIPTHIPQFEKSVEITK